MASRGDGPFQHPQASIDDTVTDTTLRELIIAHGVFLFPTVWEKHLSSEKNKYRNIKPADAFTVGIQMSAGDPSFHAALVYVSIEERTVLIQGPQRDSIYKALLQLFVTTGELLTDNPEMLRSLREKPQRGDPLTMITHNRGVVHSSWYFEGLKSVRDAEASAKAAEGKANKGKSRRKLSWPDLREALTPRSPRKLTK